MENRLQMSALCREMVDISGKIKGRPDHGCQQKD
jgi:hypothetical protein